MIRIATIAFTLIAVAVPRLARADEGGSVPVLLKCVDVPLVKAAAGDAMDADLTDGDEGDDEEPTGAPAAPPVVAGFVSAPVTVAEVTEAPSPEPATFASPPEAVPAAPPDAVPAPAPEPALAAPPSFPVAAPAPAVTPEPEPIQPTPPRDEPSPAAPVDHQDPGPPDR